MNICILEGNLDKAKEIGNKVLLNVNSGSIEGVNNYSNSISGSNSVQIDMNNNNSQFEFLNEQVNIK